MDPQQWWPTFLTALESLSQHWGIPSFLLGIGVLLTLPWWGKLILDLLSALINQVTIGFLIKILQGTLIALWNLTLWTIRQVLWDNLVIYGRNLWLPRSRLFPSLEQREYRDAADN